MTTILQEQQQGSKQYDPSNYGHHGTTMMRRIAFTILRLEFSNGKLISKTEKPKSKRKTIAKTRMKNSLQHDRFSFLAVLYALTLVDFVAILFTKKLSQTFKSYKRFIPLQIANKNKKLLSHHDAFSFQIQQ